MIPRQAKKEKSFAQAGGSASRPPGFVAFAPSQRARGQPLPDGAGRARPLSGLAPESALRVHPCRALSSAPVSLRIETQSQTAKWVIVADREK